MQDFAKDHMLSVQPVGLLECDVELGGIGVLTRVGHGHPTSAVVVKIKVLVWKFVSIYAPTCTRE